MYLQDFNQTAYSTLGSSSASELDDHVVNKLGGNPLAAYHILWRFVHFVRKWAMETPPPPQKSQLHDYISSVYSPHDGPSLGDLKDAMSGLLIIQFVYDLKSYDVS